LKKAGVHIISYGVGGWTNREELQTMASHPPDSNFIESAKFDELTNNVETIIYLACNSASFLVWFVDAAF
jgi:hypothetical protein